MRILISDVQMLWPNNGNRHACRTVNQSPRHPPPAPPVPSNDSSSVPQGQPSQETIASHSYPHPTAFTISLTGTLFHCNGEDRSNEGDFSQVPKSDRPGFCPDSLRCTGARLLLTAASPHLCAGSHVFPLLRDFAPALTTTPPSWTLTEQEGRGNQGESTEPIVGFQGIKVSEAEGCLLFGM